MYLSLVKEGIYQIVIWKPGTSRFGHRLCNYPRVRSARTIRRSRLMILGKARRGRVFAPAGALHLNRHLGVPRALQGRHRRSAGLAFPHLQRGSRSCAGVPAGFGRGCFRPGLAFLTRGGTSLQIRSCNYLHATTTTCQAITIDAPLCRALCSTGGRCGTSELTRPVGLANLGGERGLDDTGHPNQVRP